MERSEPYTSQSVRRMSGPLRRMVSRGPGVRARSSCLSGEWWPLKESARTRTRVRRTWPAVSGSSMGAAGVWTAAAVLLEMTW